MQAQTVSAHRVIGTEPGQHAQLVADELIAWHAASDNTRYLGIEFCQPLPDDEYSEWQIETGIAVCVAWCRKFGIVPSAATIRRHQDTAQGRSCGKSDPGEMLNYEAFLDRVTENVDRM